MGSIWYCSRDDVKSALDLKETARANAQVDRLIAAASDSIESLTHRRFYPEMDTRYVDWPTEPAGNSWTLWLDENELISLTGLQSGADTLTPSEYFLCPPFPAPPYTWIEINRGGPGSFSSSDTPQRAIALTGLFGYGDDETPAGALVGAATDSATTINVSNSAAASVGHLLRIGTERLIVTERRMLDTGDNLAADLAASPGVTAVPVAVGTAFSAGETILIGAERMLVVDIAGNTLIVKRAWDGSALAAHTLADDVYAPRALTVERGVLGTTAASHLDAAPIARHRPPALITQLAVAETVNALEQEGSAYARSIGSGEGARNASGAGLDELRKRVWRKFARKIRAGSF